MLGKPITYPAPQKRARELLVCISGAFYLIARHKIKCKNR
uniref:Uncharacterized protein n=1 Tax=Escherichia coli TaxID=562 RepID=A0A3S8X8Z7_ECOLX|nr:hypothetical protein [Escherichia coli]QQW38255.1 hypothetical protein [Escherichia coli]